MSRRFQFSTRLLLLATAAVALVAGALRAEPSVASNLALALLAAIFVTIAAIACIRSNGRLRSFWIGVLVGVGFAGIAAIYIPVDYFNKWGPAWNELRPQRLKEVKKALGLALTFFWCFAPLNGLIAVLVHGLVWPDTTDREGGRKFQFANDQLPENQIDDLQRN